MLEDVSSSVCPADYYCVGDNGQQACPPQSTSPPGSASDHDCTCNDGYYSHNISHDDVQYAPDDVAMEGYVHDEEHHEEPHKFCRLCPVDHYCSADAMNGCPDHTHTTIALPGAARDCLCEAGYWRNGCTRDWQAPQPYVRHVNVAGLCDPAASDLLTPADHAGKVLDELNTDALYVGRFWRQADYVDTSTEQKKCERLELCDITAASGFFEQACTPCPANIYCSVGTTHTISKHCPANSASNPQIPAQSLDDCKCNPGYQRITR